MSERAPIAQWKKTLAIWAVLIALGYLVYRALGSDGAAAWPLRVIGVAALVAFAMFGWLIPALRIVRGGRVYRFVALGVVLVAWGLGLAYVGGRLLGPAGRWGLPFAPLAPIAYWVSRYLSYRGVVRAANAGGDLAPAQVRFARTHRARGLIAGVLISNRRAARALEVLDGPPLSPHDGYWLIEAHLARGDHDQAARKVAELEGQSRPYGALARARLEIAEGEAAAALRHVDEIAPDHGWPMVYVARADALVMLGRSDEARQAIDEAQRCASFDVLRYAQAVDRPCAALAHPAPYR